MRNYSNHHLGQSIAILGSGPSLEKYQGHSIAIAVNGAAFSEFPYSYFMCGDLASPDQSWFYQSNKYSAKRLIASFIAPYDETLYPDSTIRTQLQNQLSPLFEEAKQKKSMMFVYPYTPSHIPQSPHSWFCYESDCEINPNLNLDRILRTGRVIAGATIAGVALQTAWLMGASEIWIYGCSMDNESGDNYFGNHHFSGKTNSIQRENFNTLIDLIQARGVSIKRI